MSNFFIAGAAAMTSEKDDWETPQALFDKLDSQYHFTLDPAAPTKMPNARNIIQSKKTGFCRIGRGKWFSVILHTGETLRHGLGNALKNQNTQRLLC